MSGVARRTLLRSLRSQPILRAYSSAPTPPPAQPVPTESKAKGKSKLPSKPYTITQPPQFPPPNDPFVEKHAGPAGTIKSAAVPDASSPAAPVPEASATLAQGQEYSDTTKAVVRGVARLMGYNSKASTAIRETQRMMGGIVEAAERDRVYWYEGKSAGR